MNICILIDAWEPIWGGGQTHVWEITNYLVRDFGYKADIFTRALISDDGKIYDRPQHFLGRSLRIMRLGPRANFFNWFARILWNFNVIWEVMKAHQSQPYDLIHAHAYISGIPGKILSVLLGIPVVYTVHGSNNLDLKKKNIFTLIEYLLLTKIPYSHEITVSKSFLKYSNVNRFISVIPNGVDLNRFRNIRRKRTYIYRLLWIGRFDPVKGLIILLDALDVVKKKTNIPFQITMVGDGPLRMHVEKYARQLHLEKNIVYRHHQPVYRLVKYFANADIFILPSLSEGFPLVLLEAWAARLPVIASSIGEISRLVKPGVNGYIVPPGDTKRLALTIEKAYKNRKKSWVLGKNGHILVKEKYTWSKIVPVIDQLYKKLCKKLH